MGSVRPWEKLFPGGLPYIEPLDRPIFSILDEQASKDPSKCAAVQLETGSCYTWSSLKSISSKVAGLLRSLGAGRGTQVLFAAFNRIEALAGLLGIWRSGATAVLVDPLTISEDLYLQLEGRGIRLGVVSSAFYEREAETLRRAGVQDVLVVDGTPKETGPRVHGMNEVMASDEVIGDEVRGGDRSVIMYYAGIAGRTMQVYHTHRALSTAVEALRVSMALDFTPISIVVAPLTHVLGLQVSTLTPLASGGSVVMMQRWDSRAAAKAIQFYGINFVSGAPLMHDELADAVSKLGVTVNVKLGLSGGAPLRPETQDKYVKTIGAPLVQFYGMTESWVLTYQPLTVKDVKGTVGAPIADVDVKVVNPDNPGEERGIGEVGELLAKAPWLMEGYEDPQETERAFYQGWLRTGDLLVMDERGLLYFRGVRKRMIKYKAYPIFPRDLEVMLMKHEAVQQAYVYGEPDPEVGERPVAKVVLKPGKTATEQELLNFVNSRVAFYKKLHRVYIVQSI
ncbi:MAG: class I adenylate-forming enzyme family protein [Acidilobus sp.]